MTDKINQLGRGGTIMESVNRDLRILSECLYADERLRCCKDICGICGGKDQLAAPEVKRIDGAWRHPARKGDMSNPASKFKCYAGPIRERAYLAERASPAAYQGRERNQNE